MTSDSISLVPGDLLKIERRYMVDGVPTSVTDKGRFAGVQVVGTSEHIVLEDVQRKEVRMFPLSSVCEITLVKTKRGSRKRANTRATASAAPGAPAAPAWDPGVA